VRSRTNEDGHVNNKSVFYSCCTWLAYEICQAYYGESHYVWCTPYFDPASRINPHNSVPPTSNPKEIYWSLRKEVDAGDLHSAKISQNRSGIQRGADVKLKAGAIDQSKHTEILEIAAAAQTRDFRPMLFVIPGVPITGLLRQVAVKDRASILSEEYIVESLPRQLFDAIEL
jgi:hypothetical protein